MSHLRLKYTKFDSRRLSVCPSIRSIIRLLLVSSVAFPFIRVPFQKCVGPNNYVYPSEFRKNSISYVKITFSVSVSFPFSFIRSNRIEFYFFHIR